MSDASRASRVPGRPRRGGSPDHAARHIRRRIFEGELPPGRRVPQTQIAGELGISRIPVREALIGLEREGWVTITRNRGATVNTMSADAIADHFELYGTTYGLAARRAIERNPNRDAVAARLRAILREFPGDDDPEGFTRQAFAFQRALVEAARSDRIRVALTALSTIVPGAFFVEVPDAMTIQRKGLKRVVQAIGAGDAARAQEEYVALMRQVGETVACVFATRGLLGG
jgi:DNA-binding GntR family transcriptional regulator